MAKTTKKTTASVEDKLKALHQLQVIDTQVDKIRIIRGELPLEIEDLADLIAGLNSRLQKFNEDLATSKDVIVGNKNSIALATDAIKKYEKQL
jgi:predicted  nucleic acid-binding Zn-ribbon protein